MIFIHEVKLSVSVTVGETALTEVAAVVFMVLVMVIQGFILVYIWKWLSPLSFHNIYCNKIYVSVMCATVVR